MTTFLLGVGAQKSGTTWLYAQLARHPEVGFGWKKELALWGYVWDKNLNDRKPKRLVNRWKKQFYHFPDGHSIPQHPLFTGALARSYFGEFRKIAARGYRVVSDITPHYSAISAKNLGTINALAQRYGFTPRVLFIVRDPVERAISGILHSYRRLTSATNAELVHLIATHFDSYPVEIRTRYNYTMDNLEKVFPKDKIKVSFYEDLFTPESMNGLSTWLGISPIRSSFDEKVGVQHLKVHIPDSLRREIRDFYDPVYAYCAEKFGANEISRRWKNF